MVPSSAARICVEVRLEAKRPAAVKSAPTRKMPR
jgi:hypothetical protein